MKSSDLGEFLDRDREKLVDKFKYNSRGYQDSYEAIMKIKISIPKFMKMASNSFTKMDWQNKYGGKSWANIADGWLKLYNAKSNDDIKIYIDHIYDLQHNTNTVFNKLESYYKEGGYFWIKGALDLKADAKTPWELYQNASGNAKTIAGFISKGLGYGTFEDLGKISLGGKLKFNPKKGDNCWNADMGRWGGEFWKGEYWEGGIWSIGWILDKNKEGNYEEDWEWEGNYVRSSINPKEYFDK